MKRCFLVDYENVNESGLLGSGELKKDDVIILFDSKFSVINEKELEFEKSITKAKILKMTSQLKGKYSLDFQLVSYLGLLIGNDEHCEYNIISGDKGFLSAINLIYNCTGRNVGLFETIERKINPKEYRRSKNIINYLKRAINKRKTCIKIENVINETLDYYFDRMELKTSKYEFIIRLLRGNFKMKSCKKIYDIMENSKDKMEALEVIQKTFHNVEDLEEKVINALDFFYN